MTRASPANATHGVAEHAPFREDYLGALAQLGVGPRSAAQLAEALTHRRFDTCGAAELLPVLGALVDLLHRRREPACSA
jgi:hypothetical protein